jgi:adenosylcobinamide-GDP ribazoletransferase
MRDALRLTVGTFTRIPVAAPGRVDHRTAAAAMLLAPVITALLALVLGFGAQVLHDRTSASSALIAALSVAALAYLTRGLHLDGLADTADALGSGRPATEALVIARKSDIGPFGVVTLVLVLVIQVLAFAGIVEAGEATLGLVIAVGTSRLTLVITCARGVPAARSDGLGAAVAGSVPVAWTIAAVGVWASVCIGACLWLAPGFVVPALAGIAAGLIAGATVLVISVRRLGGITGDVLGAAIEIAFVAGLVILVVLPT